MSEQFPDVSSLGHMLGFDLGFRKIGEGKPSVPATVIIGAKVNLCHVRFASGFHQLGTPPPGLLTFGVPLQGLRSWFNRNYRTSSILPFHQPGGIDGVSEKGFAAITVSFSDDYLADIASVYRIPISSHLHCPSSESVIDHSESTARFRTLLNRLISEPDSEMGQDHEDELIIPLLEAAQNSSANTDRSSARLRTRAVEQALAYIEEHKNEVVSVRDICCEYGIALRTLNRAFNERFGIGPKAYLKRQRLSAARSDLLRCQPGTPVVHIANRWGFWHMGQFAKDYRNLFGELPSQTAKSRSLRPETP